MTIKERMHLFESVLKKWKQKITAIAWMAYFFAMNSVLAFADGIGDSNLATGTMKLLEDTTTVLLIALPIIAAVAIIYFSIRRSLAEDEQEGKLWSKRIKTTLICVVLGETVTGLIKVLMSYYAG